MWKGATILVKKNRFLKICPQQLPILDTKSIFIHIHIFNKITENLEVSKNTHRQIQTAQQSERIKKKEI